MNCTDLTNYLKTIKTNMNELSGLLIEKKPKKAKRNLIIINELLDGPLNELLNPFDHHPNPKNYKVAVNRFLEKYNSGLELNQKDLIFLYDTDFKVALADCDHGYSLRKILTEREKKVKKDLSVATGLTQQEISLESDHFQSKFHWGDYILQQYVMENFNLPQKIMGKLYLNVKISKNTKFPEIVLGLEIRGLKESKEKLILPKTICGNCILGDLRDPTNIVFPEYVGGNLHLDKLQTIQGLILPKVVKRSVVIPHLSKKDQSQLIKDHPNLSFEFELGY